MKMVADDLKQEIAVALTGLSAEQMDLSPAGRPEAWSIRFIAEHLRLCFELTTHAFHEQLERGRPTRAVATLRQAIARFTVLRLGRIPYGVKAHAFVEPTRPAAGESGEAVVARLTRSLDVMQQIIAQGEQEFHGRSAVRHFVLGPLTAAQWRRFHQLHTRHHLAQITAICKEAGV